MTRNELAGLLHAIKDYVDRQKESVQVNGHAQRVEFASPKVYNEVNPTPIENHNHVPVPAVNFEATDLQPVIDAIRDVGDRMDVSDKLDRLIDSFAHVGEMLSQLVTLLAAWPEPPVPAERVMPTLRLEVSADGTKRIVPE